jgi:hypothetical protein
MNQQEGEMNVNFGLISFFLVLLFPPVPDALLGIDFSTSSAPIGSQRDANELQMYAFHSEPNPNNRSCFELRTLLFLAVSWVKITFHFVTLVNCVVGIGGWAAFYFMLSPSDLPLNLFTFGNYASACSFRVLLLTFFLRNYFPLVVFDSVQLVSPREHAS